MRIANGVAHVAAGAPALLVVEGAAGIGKTALLRAARGTVNASDELRLLSARPGELDSEFAFGVVRQLLGPVLEEASTEERVDLLAGAAAPALAALGPSGDVPLLDPSLGVLDGLYWFVVNLAAARPLALFIDDGHWADAPSLRFLGHLLRRIDGLAVLVVIALRPAEPGDAQRLVDELRLDPLAELLTLRPLSETAVKAALHSQLEAPDDAFCRACHRSSAGNPFYLRELARAVLAEGLVPRGEAAERVDQLSPASVARHVLWRIGQVGPAAAELATGAAILGDGARLGDAAALAGLADPMAARLARLCARRTFSPQRTRCTSRTRSCAAQSMPTSRSTGATRSIGKRPAGWPRRPPHWTRLPLSYWPVVPLAIRKLSRRCATWPAMRAREARLKWPSGICDGRWPSLRPRTSVPRSFTSSGPRKR